MDWDLQLYFFLMGYSATPHTTTGYSPFYLLHGRKMSLPVNDNLKAKVATNAHDIDQRIESLKASLRSAFKSVKWAIKMLHQKNKKDHDRRAKHRGFEVGDLVYLYKPARRPGLSAKFFCPWTGPHQVSAKISTLNYEIQDRKAKKQIVHINRLKAAHDSSLWKSINERNRSRKPSSKSPVTIESGEEAELLARPIPLVQEVPTGDRRPLVPSPVVPQPAPQVLDTPGSERSDPSYFPPNTPNSRRNMQPTKFETSVTRARARILPLEDSRTNKELD
jgi:hypothetical protein